MLRYSLGENDAANAIEAAIANVIADGIRTGDIMGEGCTKVNTKEMGDAIVKTLQAS